ncbi:MmgE/PrpD family protein [Aliidiomarina minuta]|uniref:MmgE/PrpD family protein n=1 Tax=Aliidiomarina minuta TaxID=880057 RepID=UPI00130027AE|nr:MmgE/PrpD family protein [Aliidiomarina minuta]
MSFTDEFVDIIYDLYKQPLSSELDGVCRQRFLDYVAVAISGSTLIKERIENYPGLFCQHQPQLTPVLGLNKYAAAETAALLNGMSAHVAELDDGERFGMVHPGAPVISALISALYQYKLSTEQFLKGIFIGYEATIRMARLLQPELKDNGYHATGPCGCVGAAMGVAAARDFSKSQMKDAFCAATTSASGILKVIRENSELKPYNAGQAALNGLTAAIIASLQFNGPGDVLEGDQGFIKMITGKEQLKSIDGADVQLIKRAYTKPYAACRHCHAPIEASIALREKHSVDSESVTAIRVITHRFAAFKHDHTNIENDYSAKMSIPFSVAVALYVGRASVYEFTHKYISDKEVQRLTKLVKVEVDDELTNLVPEKRVAIVELTFQSGEKVSYQVDLPLGEPENPIDKSMLEAKSLELLKYSGIEEQAALGLVEHLLQGHDFTAVLDNLVH